MRRVFFAHRPRAELTKIPPHARDFSRELGGINMLELMFAVWYNICMNNMYELSEPKEVTHGRGYIYSLQYHIVWATKYRKPVLKDGIDERVKQLLSDMQWEYNFRILAMEVMPDHIHLLLDCKPQFFISDMVKIFKGNIARRLFIEHPELKQSLWGGHLWNPSYFVATVSERSREQVERYIESQKEGSK